MDPEDRERIDILKLPEKQLVTIVNRIITKVKWRYPIIKDPEHQVWDAVNDIRSNKTHTIVLLVFFYRLIYRRIANTARELHEEQKRRCTDEDEISQYPDSTCQPMESYILKREISWAIRDALELEDELNRRIFILRYYKDFTYAEIGTVIKLTERAMQNRNARTLRRLRRYLKFRGFFES